MGQKGSVEAEAPFERTFKRDGEVDEVQVEVVDAPVCERPLRGGQDVLVGVEGVLWAVRGSAKISEARQKLDNSPRACL